MKRRSKIFSFFAIGMLAIVAVGPASAKVSRTAKSAKATKAKAGKTKTVKAVTPPKVTAESESPRVPAKSPVSAAAIVSSPVISLEEESEFHFFRYKMNFMMGTNITSQIGAGLLMGAQLGYAPIVGRSFYVGPEFNFSFFSPSSTLMSLLAFWYEIRLFGAPRLALALGAAAGPAFNSAPGGVSSTTFAAYLDADLVQELNDLASVRAQFRPGVVNGYFAFMLNFNICFRFL